MTGTLVQSNLDKIGDFLQDAQYQSLMVNSASYNVRIMRERKARMPFLDSQTGLAQSPLRPPLLPRHRLPPTASCTHTPGQLYRYPALPWRRRHRSYLARQHQQWLQRKAAMEAEASEHTILTMENPAASSQGLPIGDDLLDKDAFFYEESVGFLDDDEDDLDNNDDDFDDDTYGMRSSKRRRGSKHVKRSKGGFRGGGRKRRDAVGGPTPPAGRTPTADPDEINAKPYECQRCSARYKTRQGLSYHLSHTHKTDAASNTAAAAAAAAAAANAVAATPTAPGAPPDAASPALGAPKGDIPPTDSDTTLPSTPPAPDPPPTPEPTKAGGTDHSQSSYENSFKDYLNAAGANTPPAPSKKGGRSRKNSNASTASSASNPAPSSAADSSRATEGGAEEADPRNRTVKQNTFVATPNPYCDFCLGDSRYNKKTGAPEQMVSCSDCGRSGHPSCLQFTARMMEAVKRYRWQCIECKCCTLCGTAENDDQLLFCDDCDRGYHLYCVRPPLAEPPEGEWACHMCSLTASN